MKKETPYEYVQAICSYISIEERVKEDNKMNLIKQIVNKKLNHISTKELLKYSKEYEVLLQPHKLIKSFYL